MIAEVRKSILKGEVIAPPSKSIAHRCLIAAFLSGGICNIENIAMSEDIKATINCLRVLGAEINIKDNKVEVHRTFSKTNVLYCNESGSTLRFLIPIALTTDETYYFTGSNKLFERPLSVYEDISKKENFTFEKKENMLKVKGMLKSGEYVIKGDISSQFITGMIFALSTLKKDSIIKVIPPFESRSYVNITISIIKKFGIDVCMNGLEIKIKGGQKYIPQNITIEGDASNAAYIEALNFVGGDILLKGLSENTLQGDYIYKELFQQLDEYSEINISDCPDLGPVLFVVAALKNGALFRGTKRLAIKESDRGEVMCKELRKFGINIKCKEDEIFIPKAEITKPTELLSSHNDHRILMALCILLSKTGGKIKNAEAVKKSFPNYFNVIAELGAKINLITEES